MNTAYRQKFREFLNQNCKTQVCTGSTLQQLSNYLMYVNSYLNKSIKIALADGKSITIDGLAGRKYSRPSEHVYNAITEFQLDNSYANLPVSN